MTIHLQVNGEDRELPEKSTVSDLLDHLEIASVRVAVEHNRTVLPKALFAETILDEGDVVEIVHFVGGG